MKKQYTDCDSGVVEKSCPFYRRLGVQCGHSRPEPEDVESL